MTSEETTTPRATKSHNYAPWNHGGFSTGHKRGTYNGGPLRKPQHWYRIIWDSAGGIWLDNSFRNACKIHPEN